jgi:hypothetical protein
MKISFLRRSPTVFLAVAIHSATVAAPTSASAISDWSPMETVVSRALKVRVLIFLVVSIACGWLHSAQAQTNSWTNSVSGNWQDAYWSLGLPTTNQDVSLTNAGWKALAIDAATVQNFADTLNVRSLMISSPSNSYNTLLLNFAGTNTPLAVEYMTVASNSAVTLLSSALFLDGPRGAGMDLGGQFNQSDSIVSGQQVNIGYIGPGVYNLNSGILAISNLWVGAPFAGIIHQNGGTNLTLLTVLEGAEYELNDGYFNSSIYFVNRGTFRQRGGIMDDALTIANGHYILEGGTHLGAITVPSLTGVGLGSGDVVQNGGTNFGDVDVGAYGVGSYILSNGLCSGRMFVHDRGYYTQWNGTLIGGDVVVDGGPVYEKGGGGELLMGAFELNGGTVSCSSLIASGNYDQRNGTNNVSGTLTVFGEFGHFHSDGTICASNLTLELFHNAGAAKTVSFNGTTVVTNELLVYDIPGFWGSGTLIVSNITLTSGTGFGFGGEISQSGILSAEGATISLASAGSYHFGQLLGSDSSLMLPSSPCDVDFADSSEMAWSGQMLTVNQWSGSLYGGGAHRIVFGTNNSGLTPQQLTQIQFQNPSGLAPGNYPARILATGEIVPDTGAPLPPMLNLNCASNGLMHLSIGGDIGQTYTIEVSTDLVHWNTWTDQFNTSGTMTLDDNDSTNCPQRFYRAHLVP